MYIVFSGRMADVAICFVLFFLPNSVTVLSGDHTAALTLANVSLLLDTYNGSQKNVLTNLVR